MSLPQDEPAFDDTQDPQAVEALYARHIAGDTLASEELVARVRPQLERLARELGAPPDRRADAVQEAWLAFLSNGGYDPRRPLLPWLRGALRNRWRSLRRRERLVAFDSDEATLAGLGAPRARVTAEALEAFRLVRDALDKLPANQREPLRLQLLGDFTPSEIAAQLGSTPGRVRLQLHRGRMRLRELLPRGAFVLLGGLLRRNNVQPRPRGGLALVSLVAAVLVALVVPFPGERHAGGALPDVAAAPSELPQERLRELGESAGEGVDSRRLPGGSESEPTRGVLVRDVDGAPVPHVGVTFVPRDGRDPRLTQRRAVTDATGRACFDGVESVAARVLVDRGPVAELAAGEREIDVVVPRGVTLRVRALEVDGTAVAGAEVWFGDVGGSRRGGGVGRTAVDGRFELREVPVGSSFALLAHDFRRTAMLDVPGDGAEVVVRLERGAAELALTLRDEADVPIADARVLAGFSPEGQFPRLASGIVPEFPPPLEARSDEDGRVRLRGLEAGAFPLVVWAEGFVPHVEERTANAGETLELALTLPRGARVHGRVVDAEGRPLSVAQVALRTGHEPDDTHFELSTDGRFELGGLRPGRMELAVRAFDHLTEERTLDLAAGEERDLLFTLPKLVRCEGTLRDDMGLALAGFRLRLLGAPASTFAPNSDEATVGGDGSFSLAVPGAQIRRIEFAWPDSPQWKPVRRSWLVEGPGRLDIVVPEVAAQRQRVRGRLIASDAAPVAMRTLSLVDWSGAGEPVPLDHVGRTSVDGSFEIESLAAGHYELLVVQDPRDADGAPVGRVGTFEVQRGRDLDVRFDLSEAAEVRWELAFENGQRPRAPVVTLSRCGPGGAVALARCDAAVGRVHVWPGDFDLGAQGEDFMARHAPPCALGPGESRTWAPQLLEAFEVELALDTLPQDLTEYDRLELLRVADGSVVSSFERVGELFRDARLRTHLAPGDYQMRVVGVEPRVVRSPFSVSDAGNVLWPRNR